MTKNKFIKIRCNKCKNEQITFEKASSPVNCIKCGTEIAKPQGGKLEIKGKLIEILK